MDKTTHEIRLEQWTDVVSRCQSRPEGQTAKAWLAENNVSVKQYYYWLRKVRKAAYEEMKSKSLPAASSDGSITFAEVPAQPGLNAVSDLSGFRADAVLRYGAATVAVSNSASAELLGRIMEAVSHAR